MRFDLIAFNCRYSHSCLSLFYLREALEMEIPGCQVRISQFTINEPYFDILLHLTELDTDAIFFSVYIWNSRLIERLIKDLTLVKPNLPIVLGGPQAESFGEEEIPSRCSKALGPVEGLPGRFYRDLESRKVAGEYQAGKNTSFPFPYRENDFSTQLANRNVYYETSRGCPFSCSYCLSAKDTGIESKDIIDVKKDLDLLLAHQPQIVRFVDRTFNLSATRSLEIWRHLQDNPAGTVFHFEIAPDLLTDEQFSFLETVRPGKFQFEIGLQSTNPATLEAINRASDPDTSLAAVRRLGKKNNIHLHIDLILGLPYDDARTFRRSFNLAFQSPAHYIQMGLLKVLPRTPIREKAMAYELKYCQEPPYQILSTGWLSHRELNRLYWFGQCVEAFYNNRYFDAFFRYIKKNREGYEFFDRLLDLCLAENFFSFARTQEFMAKLLCQLTREDQDRDLIEDILRFDWLRTGKRYLPDFLPSADLQGIKRKMRQTLPPDYPPLYEPRTRNAFFKTGVFASFSEEALQKLRLRAGGENVVCFLPDQEETVEKLCQAVVF